MAKHKADEVTAADEAAFLAKAKGETALAKAKDEAKKAPFTREEFLAKAAGAGKMALPVTIDGQVFPVPIKDAFSSGSYGYFGNGQVTLLIDGVPVKFQTQVQLVMVGSVPPKAKK